MYRVPDHCAQSEFRAYWALKPQEEIREILEEQGISDFREFYKSEMREARTAYHTVLSHGSLYTGHVTNVEQLKHLVNHKMMDNNGLPECNTLEGLLVLRQVCICMYVYMCKHIHTYK